MTEITKAYFEMGLKAFPWMPPTVFAIFIFIIAIWTIVWKGLALWKSAKLGHKKWFIVLLVLNTIGVLDILYFYFFSKKTEIKADDAEQTELN